MSQRSIDKAVVKYVVQGLQPFCVVEQEPFRDFVKELQPNAKMMTWLTLRSMIDDASKGMKKAVTEAMRAVDHIAATTDCWSVKRRSFIGVTAHWLDHDSLKRCSAALACKQLRGSHTFDVVANVLNDIHSEFEIRETIQRTTSQLLIPKKFRLPVIHALHDDMGLGGRAIDDSPGKGQVLLAENGPDCGT